MVGRVGAPMTSLAAIPLWVDALVLAALAPWGVSALQWWLDARRRERTRRLLSGLETSATPVDSPGDDSERRASARERERERKRKLLDERSSADERGRGGGRSDAGP